MNEGDTVLVLDPKHDDSLHSHEFEGTIVGFRAGGIITVEDANGDCFDVSEDEVIPN